MAGVEGFSSCSVGIMSVQSGTSSSGSAGSMASNDISLSMSFESVVGAGEFVPGLWSLQSLVLSTGIPSTMNTGCLEQCLHLFVFSWRVRGSVGRGLVS